MGAEGVDAVSRFPCTRCGLCCQQIGHVDALKALDRGDGVCRNYDPGAGCRIYETRPLLCRIDEAYEVYFREKSREVFYQENAEVCNALQEKAGVDLIFRVKL